jgi:hypothetical protein
MDQNIAPFQITTGVWMVPCAIDKAQKRYRPVACPFGSMKSKEKVDTRKSWTHEEDEILKQIIENNGPKHWSAIAVELNELAHGGLPLRKGKQCRERWLGHLNPSIQKREWSEYEDVVLVTKQAMLGNKWSEISKFLPGRTENQIKNRWRRLDKIGNKTISKTPRNVFEELPLEYLLRQVDSQPTYTNVSCFSPLHYLIPCKNEQ